jgi:ribosomal protein S18 acetylase RimI-like enzyme
VYYPSALISPHAVTLMASAARQPCGFVTIAHDAPRFMSGVIQPNLLTTTYYVARGISRRPRTAIQIARLAQSMLTAPPDDVRGEIVFIAVDATRRGGGIGRALVQAALNHLAEQSVPYCRTKTLAANDNVIGLYTRMGWSVRDRFAQIGREYVTLVSPLIERASPAQPVPRSTTG